jgi:hypothetical protein
MNHRLNTHVDAPPFPLLCGVIEGEERRLQVPQVNPPDLGSPHAYGSPHAWVRAREDASPALGTTSSPCGSTSERS